MIQLDYYYFEYDKIINIF